MCEKKNNPLSERDYDLLKVTNNTVRLGIVFAFGMGLLALCSKINVNVSVAGADLSEDEGVMQERKRIVDNLREDSYSDEQIADLLSLSLEDVKSISE